MRSDKKFIGGCIVVIALILPIYFGYRYKLMYENRGSGGSGDLVSNFLNFTNVTKIVDVPEIIFNEGQTKVYTMRSYNYRLFIVINEKNGAVAIR